MLTVDQKQSLVQLARDFVAAKQSADSIAFQLNVRYQNCAELIDQHLRSVLEAYLAGAAEFTAFESAFESADKTFMKLPYAKRVVGSWDCGFPRYIGGQRFLFLLSVGVTITELDAKLRVALVAPGTEEVAANQIREFVSFIRSMGDVVARRGYERPRPSNVPAFLSYFWHMQDAGWPSYRQEIIEATTRMDLWHPAEGPAQDYIAYKQLSAEIGVLLSEATGSRFGHSEVERVFEFKDALEWMNFGVSISVEEEGRIARHFMETDAESEKEAVCKARHLWLYQGYIVLPQMIEVEHARPGGTSNRPAALLAGDLEQLEAAVVENAKWVNRVLVGGAAIAGSIIVLKLSGVQSFQWSKLSFRTDLAWLVFLVITVAHAYAAWLLVGSAHSLWRARSAIHSSRAFQRVSKTGGLFLRGLLPRTDYRRTVLGYYRYQMRWRDPTTWISLMAGLAVAVAIAPFDFVDLPRAIGPAGLAIALPFVNWKLGANWAIAVSELSLHREDTAYHWRLSFSGWHWMEVDSGGPVYHWHRWFLIPIVVKLGIAIVVVSVVVLFVRLLW